MIKSSPHYASTLVAASAPVFAQDVPSIFKEAEQKRKEAETIVSLNNQINHAKQVVAVAEAEIKKAEQDLAFLNESLIEASAALAEAKAKLSDNKAESEDAEREINVLATAEANAKINKLAAEKHLAKEKERLALEKANLEALQAKLAALTGTKPAENTPADVKKGASTVAAAKTATGQKTLPKTSAAK